MNHFAIHHGEVFQCQFNTAIFETPVASEELINQCKGTAPFFMIQDPAYISARFELNVSGSRQRMLAAEARFTELAGDDGIGSWYVIGSGSRATLYVIALDPHSADASVLRSHRAEGILTQRVYSAHFLKPIPDTGLVFCPFMRVSVSENILQVSFALGEYWVFARRVDTSLVSCHEAVASTLEHLYEKKYLNNNQTISWQLEASEQHVAELSSLWLTEGGVLPRPDVRRQVDLDGSLLRKELFNANMADSGAIKYASISCFGWIFATVSLILLAVVIPLGLVNPVTIPRFQSVAPVPLPESIEVLYWEKSTLHGLPESMNARGVNKLFKDLLEIVEKNTLFKVFEIEFSSDRMLTLRGEFTDPVDDPHKRVESLRNLVRQLAQRFPDYRISALQDQPYSVGERASSKGFNVVLKYGREGS